jgi:hypothetical protein
MNSLTKNEGIRLQQSARKIDINDSYVLKDFISEHCLPGLYSSFKEMIFAVIPDLTRVINILTRDSKIRYLVKIGDDRFVEIFDKPPSSLIRFGDTQMSIADLCTECDSCIPIYTRIINDVTRSDQDKTTLNVFTGFKAKLLDAYDQSKVEPVITLIKQCWANNNSQIYDFIIMWLKTVLFANRATGVTLVIYDPDNTEIILRDFIRRFVIGENLCRLFNSCDNLNIAASSFVHNRLIFYEETHKANNWNNVFEKSITTAISATTRGLHDNNDIYHRYNYEIEADHSQYFASANYILKSRFEFAYNFSDSRTVYIPVQKYTGNLTDKATNDAKLINLVMNEDYGNNFFTYISQYTGMFQMSEIEKNVPHKLIKQLYHDDADEAREFIKMIKLARFKFTKKVKRTKISATFLYGEYSRFATETKYPDLTRDEFEKQMNAICREFGITTKIDSKTFCYNLKSIIPKAARRKIVIKSIPTPELIESDSE